MYIYILFCYSICNILIENDMDVMKKHKILTMEWLTDWRVLDSIDIVEFVLCVHHLSLSHHHRIYHHNNNKTPFENFCLFLLMLFNLLLIIYHSNIQSSTHPSGYNNSFKGYCLYLIFLLTFYLQPYYSNIRISTSHHQSSSSSSSSLLSPGYGVFERVPLPSSKTLVTKTPWNEMRWRSS